MSTKGFAVPEVIPFELLAENQCGQIVEIIGPSIWQQRLEELGLRTGKEIRLVRRGEPCIVGIDDQRISLRIQSDTMILVEVDSASPRS